jgi:uncharacterized protein YndB with AHSA1/START domain
MANDAIEREIFIRAEIDRVWSLISKVGFWVGDDLHFETDANEGELVVVNTTRYGSFPVQVERLEAPRYAAYRWASGFPGANPTEANSTIVEFTLVEQDGGVVLRLRESGFAELASEPSMRDSIRDANVAGWSQQLDRLCDVVAGAVVG